MPSRQKPRHTIDLLFTIGLFGLFAVSSLMVMLAGAAVYRDTTARAEADYQLYTPLAYLEQKIYAHDTADGVSLTTLEDTPALCLHAAYGEAETPYTTYIFVHEGSLKELFIKDGDPVTPARGTTLMPLSELRIDKISDSRLHLTAVSAAEAAAEMTVYLHAAAVQTAAEGGSGL